MTEQDSNLTLATLDQARPADANGAVRRFPAESPLRVWLGALMIVLAGAAAFSATLGVPFHFEDRLLISENSSVHHIATLQETFGRGDAGPVVWAIHALNWAVTPDDAASFHAVNLALHLANALLVYFICRIYIRPGEKDALAWLPMAAGLLFALHPLTTESVNYVVGRSSILVTTFSLGAVLAMLLLDTGSELRRRACLITALVCVALALGSHRAAWMLPIILISADWCRNGSGVARRLPVHGLIVAATIAVVIATMFGRAESPRGDGPSLLALDAELPPQIAIARAADLSINRRSLSTVQSAELDSEVVSFAGNSVENFGPTNVIPGIAFVFVAALGGAVALYFRRLLGLGLVWFAVALVFGAVWARNGMPFSERAVYFPLAGLAIAVAGALTFVGGRQRVRMAAAACVVILLSVCAIASFTRSRTWLDEQALWELARDTAAKSPVPYHRLAVIYGERGERALVEASSFLAAGESVGAAAAQQRARDAFAKVAEYAQSAVMFGAEGHPIHVLLGRALHMSGSGELAEATLLEVLRADPIERAAIVELASIHEMRANFTGDRSELARAADLYEQAMTLAPATHDELGRYGLVLMGLGDLRKARIAYARAAQLQPEGPVAAALENIDIKIQRIAAIEQRAARLLAANPADPNGPMALAMAAIERNKYMPVLYTLADLLDVHGGFARAWVMLGFTQARMGQADAFLEQYGAAPPLMPVSEEAESTSTGQPPPPWLELAAACVRFSLWDEAATYLLYAGENSGDPRLPLIIVADFARDQSNVPLYGQFLVRATEEHPNEPMPWLRIADLSIQLGNAAEAEAALREAETRGASAEELAARQPDIEELRESGIDTIETVS